MKKVGWEWDGESGVGVGWRKWVGSGVKRAGWEWDEESGLKVG